MMGVVGVVRADFILTNSLNQLFLRVQLHIISKKLKELTLWTCVSSGLPRGSMVWQCQYSWVWIWWRLQQRSWRLENELCGSSSEWTTSSFFCIWYSHFIADCFPTITSSLGSQVVPYDGTSCLVDAMCKIEEFSDAFINAQDYDFAHLGMDETKPRNSRFEATVRRKWGLEEVHGNLNLLKEDVLNTEEKVCDQQLKPKPLSCLPRLVPTVSFNDKHLPISPGPPSQMRKSAVIRLSFKRLSNVNEATKICKSSSSFVTYGSCHLIYILHPIHFV